MDSRNLIACPACDLLHRKDDIPAGAAAYCRRCETPLYHNKAPSIDRSLALVLGALITIIIANVCPFLTLELEGRLQETVLASGIVALFHQGRLGLAFLVLLTGIVGPIFQLSGLLYILLPLRLGFVPLHFATVCRWVRRMQPWSMTEIFLLGTLVSVVKLAHSAVIVPGAALFAFMALIFMVPAAVAALPWERIWESVRYVPPPTPTSNATLVACHSCKLVSPLPAAPGGRRARCPRCAAALNMRKPSSLSRTWALVIAASLLYIPANLLPVTLTTSFGRTQADTILTGVIHFMVSGNWLIALIIFTASIMVPLVKLAVLVYLLISIRFKSAWRPGDRTRLYRVIEAVGRWSMIDIFAVTVLVALVRMGTLASIEAGPGGIYFAAVVVITILAADCFDSRLIWDTIEERQ